MPTVRGSATATFLTVLAVTFLASTFTSTATSEPQPSTPSVALASAERGAPTTEPVPTSTPTTVPADVPVTVPAPAASPDTPVALAPAATATAPAPAVTSTDLLTTARQTLDAVIPAGWFTSADLQWALVAGSSSRATNNPPTIEVGVAHFEDPAKLRFILAHEWGHHVAFFYGDQTLSPGNPPAGFDAHGNDPIEMWAGCVAEVLVPEYWTSTHGLPRCAPSAKEFTAQFLAAGPH